MRKHTNWDNALFLVDETKSIDAIVLCQDHHGFDRSWFAIRECKHDAISLTALLSEESADSDSPPTKKSTTHESSVDRDLGVGADDEDDQWIGAASSDWDSEMEEKAIKRGYITEKKKDKRKREEEEKKKEEEGEKKKEKKDEKKGGKEESGKKKVSKK